MGTDRLVVATTNPGKMREIRRILADVPVTLVALADFPAIGEPEETGRTFAENAALKARYYGRHVQLPTVAEDSGLAIDVLGGRPGVESARYPGRTYDEKFANLYAELSRHPRPWIARFICSIVVIDPRSGQTLFSAERAVEGEIADRPSGPHGFGYDPIFFFPPYARTFGDVTDDQKTAVSHRGQAFRRLGEWLRDRGDREQAPDRPA